MSYLLLRARFSWRDFIPPLLYSPVLLSWIIFKYCNNDSRSSQNPWEYWILILSRTKRWVWWEQGKNEGDVRLLLFSQLEPKNLWNRIYTIFKGVCVYKLYAVFIVIEEIKKNLNSVFFNFRESQQKQDAFYKQWNLYQTTFSRVFIFNCLRETMKV